MQPRRYKRPPGNILVPIDELLDQGKIDACVAERWPKITPPPDWNLGALLNVRNAGSEYVVTLFPEEVDPRKPERALRFPSQWECQAFVSSWYARTWAAGD